MTLLAWLITSTVFALIGTGFLLLLRRWVRKPLHMRALIWAVIWVSLLLPLAFSPFSGLEPARQPTAPTVGEFCHCKAPNAGDHLRYQANLTYDFLLLHHREVNAAWLMAGSLLFAIFLVRSVRTLHRLRRAPAQQVQVRGLRYHVLRDLPQLPVGAVGLAKRYLHWHSALDALPPSQRRAIEVHEETHLRHLHTWERVALAALGIVWWANPAWFFLRRELLLQAEFAADEAAANALGDRKQYALLLLQLRTQHHNGLLMTFSKPSQTGRRIRHLLHKGETSPWRRAAAVAFFAAALCGDAYAGTQLQRQWEKVEVYHLLNRTHQVTGQTEFCKTCAFEKAAAECSE
jgi:beta-lactamase regulating signal transducer with metallopeptidase domain